MSVDFQRTTRRYIPEDGTLQWGSGLIFFVSTEDVLIAAVDVELYKNA
jgi:hypothetical protein